MKHDIVIVGVGGQGTLLASKLLGQIAIKNGYDVRVSEVHGMSQRGGSVITYVRMSNDEPIHSAIVEEGMADVVLAFENLEAYRALPYLKRDGTVIANVQEILPMPVIVGAAEYPNDCLKKVAQAAKLVSLDAAGIAAKCGTFRAANVVLLGVLSNYLPFSESDWLACIESEVKPAFVDVNKKAFLEGCRYVI